LAYATQNGLPATLVRNSSGNFVAPTIESTASAALAIADTLSPATDFRVSIVDPPRPDAYPIASFTWVLIYQQQRDGIKGRALVDFLRWGLTDGQQYGPPLHYSTLPAGIVATVQKKLDTVTFPQ
jgi:phosphate transport system substrate-binding protein